MADLIFVLCKLSKGARRAHTELHEIDPKDIRNAEKNFLCALLQGSPKSAFLGDRL